GPQAVRGQLALAGRAVLPAHGQAAARARLPGLHPVPAGAAPVLPDLGDRGDGAQPPAPLHPAAREHLAPLPGQAPGLEHAPAGTWGPEVSHFLTARDSRLWIEPQCQNGEEPEEDKE